MQLPFHSQKCKVQSAKSSNPTIHYSLITNHFKVKHAFTLIELLVTISIIGILMAAGTVYFTNAQQKGRDSKRKADLKSIQQALELYYNTNGEYPPTTCSPGAAGSAGCNVANQLGVYLVPTYISKLPNDPLYAGDSYWVQYNYDKYSGPPCNVVNKYRLWAWLENKSDPEGTATCGESSPKFIENNKLLFLTISP